MQEPGPTDEDGAIKMAQRNIKDLIAGPRKWHDEALAPPKMRISYTKTVLETSP